MRLDFVEGQWCFCYELDSKFYPTDGSLLSEDAAHRMVGRATRAWVVVPLLENEAGDVVIGRRRFLREKTRRVLKDVWLDEGALLEAQIQSTIEGFDVRQHRV